MIVVTDTSPLRYLILLGAEGLLPKLYGRVICPDAVFRECASSGAPALVRAWTDHTPDWLEIREDSGFPQPGLARLDDGERAAIELAIQEGADAVLMDEIAGRQAARDAGLIAVGTIGILAEAARNGWIDYDSVVTRLQSETNFRVSPMLWHSGDYIASRGKARPAGIGCRAGWERGWGYWRKVSHPSSPTGLRMVIRPAGGSPPC